MNPHTGTGKTLMQDKTTGEKFIVAVNPIENPDAKEVWGAIDPNGESPFTGQKKWKVTRKKKKEKVRMGGGAGGAGRGKGRGRRGRSSLG
jgi:hypothetical protein